MECKICGSKDYKIEYKGKIRDGFFGNYTKDDVKIYKCCTCGAMYHENERSREFYESSEYREKMGEGTDRYEALHDREVLEKLNYTGTDIFRDKIVADIGCGGGSFLDFVGGGCGVGDCRDRTNGGISKKAGKERLPYVCLCGRSLYRLRK